MIKLIVDCMGGDHSPDANIKGAVDALNEQSDLYLILTGDKNILEEKLKAHTYDKNRLEIVHAPDVVTGDDRPTDVIRMMKESSMVKGINLLRERDDIAGIVSVGATGVLLTGAVLRVGRLKGVERPPFCPILPTMNGRTVAICDSGANLEVTPDRLFQFALMSSLYMEKIYGVEKPRVALLNVGVEENKGDELRQKTHALLKASPLINFAGNMESRDLLSGKYDVVVCDGFSGNVLIKTTEGTCVEILKKLKNEIMSSLRCKIGALFMKKMLKSNIEFMDYQNYGGSVMLGTKKMIVKGHGNSKAKGIKKCILQAYIMESKGLNQAIENEIEKSLNKQE